ncbi:putative baseplate assembly protein [Niabella ginsenosidivorans]|uniref:Putative baseplate assembly protein n=1 Tax=Niabella ginsenosidivorans TaxID=1176587 RepID=A0A1A9I1F4_9BACT|nr:putative baseplate assembly protein [Niabella ginsenosidivorans]ANH80394.1 putative baseplate assembly protein [Niabella ginsenosidivorans]
MNYFCCDEERRTLVINHPVLNGIDYLEVVDNPEDANAIRQTVLQVYLLKEVMPGTITTENISIEGGERIRNIEVLWVWVGPAATPPSLSMSPPGSSSKVLTVKVKAAGDFSVYQLRLINLETENFDPILSSVDFSFKVVCDNEFDCSPQCTCTEPMAKEPDINYLVKDYSSFKQLMLDRMALLLPRWQERNAADPGIMLVELLAYVGDYLSYRQDAIATEAYLGTARKRISVRRHARLVDYRMHDGANARTWVHFEVAEGITNLQIKKTCNGAATSLLTRSPRLPLISVPGTEPVEMAMKEGALVFELLHDATLDARNNIFYFYTWGNKSCSLQTGAVTATFDTHLLALKPGQVLIFEEIAGPRTGKKSDADPNHRHPVKVTSVSYQSDPVGNPYGVPPDNTPRPVTVVEWAAADALPFDLCINTVDENGDAIVVSAAIGNNILVDHGYTLPPEQLPGVPEAQQAVLVKNTSCDPCKEQVYSNTPARYNPELKQYPVTRAVPCPADPSSAYSLINADPTEASPAVVIRELPVNETWTPLNDLLSSNSNDKNFVVETESDGVSYLRFGNDVQGKFPAAGSVLQAVYRIGNGLSGNIGSEALQHIVTADPALTALNIQQVRNPLPAVGGVDPESIEEVRNRAPIAFRKQERAVTMEDYETVSQRLFTGVQKSTAAQRWTGSWRTVFLTVDRLGGQQVDETFKNALIAAVEKYRMAGEDVEAENPVFVSLEIDITVCVRTDYLRSQVKQAVAEMLSTRELPGGRKGVFHPDNFSFGQPVYLSAVYAAAQQVAGVYSITITKFQRQGQAASNALSSGVLTIGRNEIARLDNDPNFREHGVLNITLQGGK